MIIYRKKCYARSMSTQKKTNNKQPVCLSGSQATSEATKQLKQQTSLLVSQFSPVSQSQSVSQSCSNTRRRTASREAFIVKLCK